jgi:hypothetical protein
MLGEVQMRDFLAIVSFIMAVLGGLSAMFNRHRDKQTMGSIVGIVFLIAFFLLVDKDAKVIFQAACLISFALAVTGGIVTIRSNQQDTRVAATITGIVSLGTSLLILFTYL